MTAGATYFDLGRFRATAPIPASFPHLVTENFLRPEHRAADAATAERSRNRHRWPALRKKLNPFTSGEPLRRIRPPVSPIGGGKADGTPAFPERVRPPASPIGGEGDSGAGPTPSTFQSAELESWPDR